MDLGHVFSFSKYCIEIFILITPFFFFLFGTLMEGVIHFTLFLAELCHHTASIYILTWKQIQAGWLWCLQLR